MDKAERNKKIDAVIDQLFENVVNEDITGERRDEYVEKTALLNSLREV